MEGERRPKRRRTAKELELVAARRPASAVAPPVAEELRAREPLAMLVRRGFEPGLTALDLPFDPDLDGPEAERLAALLDRYAFRLFLRGAILASDGFLPDEATRFLKPAQAAAQAEQLVELGLAERLDGGRYRLRRKAATFGPTLEWFVARELCRRFALDAISGVQLRVPGVGGDLDVVAAAEGRLIAIELKSSPPKHLSDEEVGAFFDRLQALRPHLAIFAIDTALRLSDKVVPLLAKELAHRRGDQTSPRRIERDLWALTPRLFLVNAKPSLISNIGRVIAEGFLGLAQAPL